ncbi:amino acid ABC transporter permease [Streptomyces sp. NPDC002577]
MQVAEPPRNIESVPPRSEYKPVRSPGQIASVVVGLIFAAWILALLADNKNIDYGMIASNISNEMVLEGLLKTFELTVVSMLIGILLGVVIAVARMSGNRVLTALAEFYIWFFRGVPLLVQIMIWGNFALLFPRLGLGVPFTDMMLFSVPTNSAITVFVASVLALSLHEAAYMAEVVRGGIQSVDGGQEEAAKAIGMTRGRILRRIVLPQALRIIIPPTGNQLISLLKASAMVSVIAGGELMTVANDIGSVSYKTLEMLTVATFWYLAIVSVMTVLQRHLERRLAKGSRR